MINQKINFSVKLLFVFFCFGYMGHAQTVKIKGSVKNVGLEIKKRNGRKVKVYLAIY